MENPAFVEPKGNSHIPVAEEPALGEIVRLGDCEEDEWVAREAGDFARIEAVRADCRGRSPAEWKFST